MQFITRKHLSRRTFLRGAGATIALPLLESMVPAGTALAQTAANPAKSRVAFIYVPHGAVMANYRPATEGTDWAFTPILEPLEPYRSLVNIISDTWLPTAYGTDASAGANHTRSSAVWLACVEPTEGAAAQLGTSIDQVIAQAQGQDTPLPSIELTIEGGSLSCGSGLSCAYRNTISWQSPTSPLPMEHNPQVLFERLFGDGSTAEQRAQRRAQAASLLDSVTEQVHSMNRALPAADRHRLGQYLNDVREIERRIEMAAQQIPADLAIPEQPVGVPDDFEVHIKLLFDLQVLAWQAEITRVTTMMLGHEVTNAVYPNSGIRDPFHNLSHHSNNQEALDKLTVLQTYHMSMIAYLIEKLQATPDGDRNLLENSLVLYGSGMSNSNQHDHDPLPIALIGGASGRLKGGRHIRNPARTNLSNLYVGILNTLGIPTEQFGDSTGAIAI